MFVLRDVEHTNTHYTLTSAFFGHFYGMNFSVFQSHCTMLLLNKNGHTVVCFSFKVSGGKSLTTMMIVMIA